MDKSTINELMLEPMPACVVFQSTNRHWLAWLLRRDCRHVWCALQDRRTGSWLGINVTLEGVRVDALAPADFDLAGYYREMGLEVIEVQARPWERQLSPFVLNTCVGMTKQVLGVRSWAVTPHQLRKYLYREQKRCA